MQAQHRDTGGVLSSPTARGVFYALLATFVWSFNFIAGRGLADAIPPCTLALLRWLTAFCAIFPFALPELRREWRHFTQNKWYYLATGAIGIAFFNTALYIAAHEVAALNMSLIFTSSPLFTIILSRIFFGEPIPPARVAGIATVLAGILILIARGDLRVLATLSFQPMDLLVLLSAFSFSLYALLVRKKPQGGGQRSYFAVIFGIGIILLLPFSIWEISSGAKIDLSSSLVIGILYMGLGASIFSFWFWSKSIELIGPARAAVVYYTMPLFCAIEAVLMLGEPILWVHYAGGALIISGLLLATRQSSR
jgi:drug/metabolite transporter (DMT)-like permease